MLGSLHVARLGVALLWVSMSACAHPRASITPSPSPISHEREHEHERELAPEPEAGERRRADADAPSTEPNASVAMPVASGLDRDSDGIVDANDQCPDQAEDYDGHRDEDGCPDICNGLPVDPCRVRIADGVLVFAAKSKALDADQRALLDDVVEALRAHPEITLEIAGHTDGKGSVEANDAISSRRAERVRDYLIDHGVEPERLTAVGYGERRPVDTNRTEQGRARNRRVELVPTAPDCFSSPPGRPGT